MTNEDKDSILRRIEGEISDSVIWKLVFNAFFGTMHTKQSANEIFKYVMECIQKVLNEEVE